MIVLKVVGIIVAVIFVLVVLVFGGGIWMINSAGKDRYQSIQILEKEFPVGAMVQTLPDRAKELKAGGFMLYERQKNVAPSSNPPPAPISVENSSENFDENSFVTIASADSSFIGKGGPSFEDGFTNLKMKFAAMKTGQLIVDFPVFMTARWVFGVKFDQGRVTSAKSTYLD